MWSYSIFFSTTNRIFLGFCGSQRYLNLDNFKENPINYSLYSGKFNYLGNILTLLFERHDKKDNPKNEDPDEKEKKFLEKIEEEINILRVLKERNEENFYGERKDLLNKIAIKLT